jgi:hypothetical protein
LSALHSIWEAVPALQRQDAGTGPLRPKPGTAGRGSTACIQPVKASDARQTSGYRTRRDPRYIRLDRRQVGAARSTFSQRIADAPPTARVLRQDGSIDEPGDVAQRCVGGASFNRRLFGRGELALQAIQQTVEHVALTLIECQRRMPFPKLGFVEDTRRKCKITAAWYADKPGGRPRIQSPRRAGMPISPAEVTACDSTPRRCPGNPPP